MKYDLLIKSWLAVARNPEVNEFTRKMAEKEAEKYSVKKRILYGK